MADLYQRLLQSCRFARAHIIEAERTLTHMQRDSAMATAEDLSGYGGVAERIKGHQNLIRSRRAHFQRLEILRSRGRMTGGGS